MTAPITGPIPPYQNMPIRADFYKPRRFDISNIILGQTTSVFSSSDMDYEIGQLIRLIIPQSFGSYQLNEKKGYVIQIPSLNEVIVEIDSSMNVDAFIYSPGFVNAQILPVGDINTGAINESGRSPIKNYIPGSFRNISPR